MPKHPKAIEMYEFYQNGYSLAQVAEVFGGTRQSVCSVFKNHGFKCRPRKKPLPKKILNKRKR